MMLHSIVLYADHLHDIKNIATTTLWFMMVTSFPPQVPDENQESQIRRNPKTIEIRKDSKNSDSLESEADRA